MGVEEHSTGEEVGPSALRGKPRKLVVRPKEGAVLVGRWVEDDPPLMGSFVKSQLCRWVKGAREGPGNTSTLRLEKVKILILILERKAASSIILSVLTGPHPIFTGPCVHAGRGESSCGELHSGSTGGSSQDGDGR